jgi:hypothetical protein
MRFLKKQLKKVGQSQLIFDMRFRYDALTLKRDLGQK